MGLRLRRDEITRQVLSNLSPWLRVDLARHPRRPQAVDYVELLVVKFKAPNMKSGKTCMYDLEVYTRIKPDRAEDLKEILLKCEATVKDRLNRLVRSAEQETLREDGLETLRLQIRHELGAIIGDEKLIEEILIPRCTPLNLGY